MEFKLGDLVRYLVSAIPMVVVEIKGDQITVSWLDPKGNVKRATFPASSLKPYRGRRPIRVTF